jgi:hypothetical protein
MDSNELLRVLRAFNAAGLRYVVVGGVALGFHGLVRATEDLDLFIEPTAANVDALKRAFRAAYPGDANIEQIAADELLGDYPAIRYYPPETDLYFDVLTRLGTMTSYDEIEAEVKDVLGIPVPTATPAALYRMKRGTVRPVDQRDADLLRRRFKLEG